MGLPNLWNPDAVPRPAGRSPSRRPGKWQRRDTRYAVALDVQLLAGHEHLEVRTLNVSRRGLLVEIDAAPASRQLIQVRIALPDGGPITVHGMVVHAFGPRKGRPGGAGIQFYAVPPTQASAWEAFLAALPASSAIANHDPTPGSCFDVSGVVPLPTRRRFPRFPARLAVTITTSADVWRVYSSNVSKGGMFIETDLDLPLDAPALIQIFVPGHAEAFHVEGAVVRRVRSAGEHGVGVEFKGLDEERRQELLEFISDGVETLDDALVADAE